MVTTEEIARIVASVAGGAANVQDIYPLAPLQEGILFHHLLTTEGDPYLMHAVYRFDSRARVDRFVGALQAVIDRHDILRTAVVWEGLQEPLQVVWRHAPLVVEDVDLGLGAGDAAEALGARFSPRHYRLDLRAAPLFRIALAFDAATDRWVMLLLLHHIIGDHTTLETLYQEVQAYLIGEESRLPAPLPFRNFVAQARLGTSREEHEAFFREMLGDVDEVTAPFGIRDVQGDGSRIAESDSVLDPELTARLRAQARTCGVSTATICHLAWARVLASVSGRDDVVFGTVVFGRMQSGNGAGRALGLFINTLPVRIRVGDESVRAGVRATHALLAQVLRHEHASLALAQRCSRVEAPAPLFSALLNYRHNSQPAESTANAWEGIEALGGGERSNYPVTLSVDDFGDALGLAAQVDASLDPAHVCDLMQTALERLVDALETAPDTAVRALDVLPAIERRRLVVDWNATEAPYPADACVHELFAAQAARDPGAVAVVYDETHLTYGELNARANRLARHLRELGVGPDVRVALCVERGLEMVVGLLAILKAGGAYVPLDPSYPPERLRYMLQDSAPVAVITHAHVAAAVHELLHAADVRAIDLEADSARWEAAPSGDVERGALTPRHLAFVIYTSGSTGRPKGVMVEHGALVATLAAADAQLRVGAGDVMPNVASHAFDISLLNMLLPLTRGGSTVVVARSQVRDVQQLVERTRHATIFQMVPSLMATWLDYVAGNGLADAYRSLRVLLAGGEAVPASLVRRLREQFPGVAVVELYGPTEAVLFSTSYWDEAAAHGGVEHCIGRPIANTRLYILDGHGEPVPLGVAGELYIGGAGVARGYLNQPELTAERFLASPFVAGDRLYKTGDVCRYLADGNIEYLGRNDFQVKIRGFRIELGEIEARLSAHESVREVVVLAREDVAGEKRLVAYYTLADESGADGVSADALRAHLSSALPEYMVPAAYVPLASLPLTPNDKVDRRALPAPDGGSYALGSYEAPLGAVEEALAQIWREVLAVERVGRHDDFFALGGHSLLAVRMLARMRAADLHGEIRALFTSPTLAGFAGAIGGASGAVVVPANRIPAGSATITPEMLSLVELSQDQIDGITASVSGGAANVQDIYPLAPLQEGILFHHLLTHEGDPYLLHAVQHFDSRARVDRFVAALQAVIDRHDILRTAIAWEGLPEPVQVVWRHARLRVEEPDLGRSAGDAVEALMARLDRRHYRLDVREAPLLRVALAREVDSDSWVMALLSHHLVSDHTTLELMFQEVQAHLLGQDSQLPSPLPFRDFVAQARLGTSREEHETFFRAMLGDVAEVTAPFGLQDVQRDGSGVAESRRMLDPSLNARLRAQSRAVGVSTASVCHVAWAQVLARVSGREDVVFGTVLFGRMQAGAGAERGLGLFMNTLPVRIRVGEAGVRESVRAAHGLLAQLLHHEHAPLALAQRCSAVAAPSPLFSALLNYRHNAAPPESSASAWEGIEFLGGEERTNYPLSLAVDDFGDALGLAAKVDAWLDPSRICDLMHTALERLVDALERAPGTPVRVLDVLPEAERRQLVVDWNATEAAPVFGFVHEAIERCAAQDAAALAVVQGAASLTYGALNAHANRLARYLRGLGVGPDVRVVLCMERSPDLLVGLLAVLKAGGAYVPVDAHSPSERLRELLQDSAPAVVLTHAGVPAAAQSQLALACAAGGVAVLDLQGDAHRWAGESAHDLGAVGLRREHLAYVIYTSGSTGRPKGAMVEHGGWSNLMDWFVHDRCFTREDRVLVMSPHSFDQQQKNLVGPLLVGGAVFLAPEPFEPRAILAQIEREAISFVHVTPSVLSTLIDEDDAGCLRSVRTAMLGGESIQVGKLLQMGEPRPQFVNNYGPTECSAVATSYSLSALEPHMRVPVGRPIRNTRMYILDRHGEPVPIGVVGELHIGGVNVGRGYLNQPELTAERFIASPFVAGDRLYKTGDLGRYLADGNIEYVGRNDFQVKIRGFRIELGEIEARLAAHASVRDAVVLAREDVAGEKRLVAYYTLAEGAGADGVSVDALRAHLSSALPDYMVPAAYVLLESLPLTRNGKVDRKALPAPGGSAYVVRSYEAPAGAVEETLAQIWREVLDVERVGRQDNFFELGGHSLLAVRVLSRMRQELAVEVSLTQVFASPVLAELARVVAEARRAVLPPLTHADRSELLPASFAQQRLWFLAQLGESEAYHIPLGLHVRGELDRAALRRALDRLVWRHESLRTTLYALDGVPYQRIAPADSGFALLEHDLRADADADAAADVYADACRQLERLQADEARAAFDLEAGPLIRGRLIRLGESEHVLLITMHHIVSDGWSQGVFLSELSALYQAYRVNAADPLPALPIQYADYAAWQRGALSGALLQEQVSYWQQTLAGVPPVHQLPTDRARPAQQDHAGAALAVELDAELSAALKALSRRHGTTLFMTLLSAWATLLGRLSVQDDVVIGTPVANRTRTELEELIGFFVNTLAVRLDLSGTPTVSELLARVKARTLAAQEHQDVPFEHVVEVVRPERSLAHAPLFQVMFAWQNTERGELAFPGLELAPLGGTATVAQFDLSLGLMEAGDRIVGSLRYATSLFDRATVERYWGYMRHVLTAMVADDRQRIDRLPLLSESERRQLVVDWNATEAPYPDDACVHELFEAQAARDPAAVAVVYDDAQLTYGELNARANRLARYLRGLGVGPDVRVALCVERGLEMVVGLLAILKAGGAYVPLDPSYPPERLRYMLQDSAPVAVITHAHVAPAVQELLHAAGPTVIDLRADAARWEAAPSGDVDRAELTVRHLAFVIYTSGSTGRPKGVMVEHGALVATLSAADAQLRVGAGDVMPNVASHAFDISLLNMLLPLTRGGSTVVVARSQVRDVQQLVERTRHATIFQMVPSLMTTWLDYVAGNGLADAYRSLRVLLPGGEAVPASLARRLREQFPGVEVVEIYGPTEAVLFSTSYWDEAAAHGGVEHCIGRPIANTRLYILDGHGEPAPLGVAGELYIGGAGVARGYLNQPELTAERFLASPFVAGDRLYKTGDVCRYLADGNIEYLGRNDLQVKIRGFRIELGEIEARLAAHESVRDAVVLAREDAPGEKRLVAYYTLADESGADVSVESLRAHLASALPDYMVPAAYVPLESLPLTPNDKVDRKALPAPDGSAYVVRSYEAPLGQMEQTLARIWREVLAVERVGRHDDFFALGGHSLRAVQLVSALGKAGLGATVTDVFMNRTIEALGAALQERAVEAHASRIIEIRKSGDAAPLFVVHEIDGRDIYFPGLASSIDPDVPVYGLVAIPLDQPQLHTLEGMAARLIELIRTVQPSGPYRVAGWSFGGLLAYEVALQLLGQDETVEFIGLLDSSALLRKTQRSSSTTPEEALVEILADATPKDSEHREFVRSLDVRTTAVGFEELHAECRRRDLIPPLLAEYSQSELKRYCVRYAAHRDALFNYVIQPISIPIDLFVAAEHPSRDPGPLLGWEKIVPADGIVRTGVPGDHASMMDEHVSELGKAVSERLRARAAAAPATAHIEYNPSVIVQQGAPRDPVVFCVPGAGASVSSFFPLSVALGQRWTVYGLQPRGVDLALEPHATVEAAASAYLRAMDVMRRDDVHLIGHSFGGWVVFDIALRMAEMARAPASVAVIDSDPPGPAPEATDLEVLTQWIHVIELAAGRPLGLDKAVLATLDRTATLRLFHERMVAAGLLPRRAAPETLLGSIRSFGTAVRTPYAPKRRYEGPVQLVCVDDTELDAEANRQRREDTVFGWMRFAPDVRPWDGPGNHLTVLSDPHVMLLADWWKDAVSLAPR